VRRAMPSEPWLTKRELAVALKVSVRTIERHRVPGQPVGGQKRYRLSEALDYLSALHAGTLEGRPNNVVELCRPRPRSAA
jgi:hypothetical protein